MTIPEPLAQAIRDALAAHRKAAERAEQANDTDAMKAALHDCWAARMRAWEAIHDAEVTVRAQAYGQAA